MGSSMCGHIFDAGYSVAVNTRTKSKADELIGRGAKWFDTPRQLAANCDIVFSIVGYPNDVREVLIGEHGVVAGLRAGGVLIDMTTSQPSLAIEINKAAQSKGIHSLDAPVSGGDIGAKNQTLSIMVGGDQAVFNSVMPLFELLGKTIVYQGPAGSGQHTKMVNQTLIATNMIGVCEALIYAHNAGLNLEDVLRSVSSGAAGSWSLSNLAPRILKGDFDPGFFVEHFIKDMGIALDEARKMNLSLPGLGLAHQLYLSLAANGKSQCGTQALYLTLAQMSGLNHDN